MKKEIQFITIGSITYATIIEDVKTNNLFIVYLNGFPVIQKAISTSFSYVYVESGEAYPRLLCQRIIAATAGNNLKALYDLNYEIPVFDIADIDKAFKLIPDAQKGTMHYAMGEYQFIVDTDENNNCLFK